MSERILVFIPAYRCAGQIGRVLAQFGPGIRERFSEILVVENRSPDDTLAAAVAAAGALDGIAVTVVQNTENYSLGGSHKVAFAYALEHGFDYLVVLHGDDQGAIADLVPQLDRGAHRACDSLLGARFAPGATLSGYSWFRTFGNRVFNLLISAVTGRRVHDMGAGLNMYKATFLADRFYLSFPNNLTFNVYMLYYSFWKRSPTVFFPLTWREDDQVSNARIFRQAWIILGLTWRYLVGRRALFARTTPAGAMAYTSTVVLQRPARS